MTRATLPGGLRIIGALTTPRAMEVVSWRSWCMTRHAIAVFANTKVFSAVVRTWGAIIERFKPLLHLGDLISEILTRHCKASLA